MMTSLDTGVLLFAATLSMGCPCDTIIFLNADPVGSRVYIKTLVPQESNEGHIVFPGQLDGKTGWCAYRRNHLYTRYGRLLYQLKAGPAAEEQDVLAEGQVAFLKVCPDQLVQRIMPSDVFFQELEVSLHIE